MWSLPKHGDRDKGDQRSSPHSCEGRHKNSVCVSDMGKKIIYNTHIRMFSIASTPPPSLKFNCWTQDVSYSTVKSILSVCAQCKLNIGPRLAFRPLAMSRIIRLKSQIFSDNRGTFAILADILKRSLCPSPKKLQAVRKTTTRATYYDVYVFR